jgi:archaellum component FlaC
MGFNSAFKGLKEKYKRLEDDVEDVSSFWMTFRKGEGTEN